MLETLFLIKREKLRLQNSMSYPRSNTLFFLVSSRRQWILEFGWNLSSRLIPTQTPTWPALLRSNPSIYTAAWSQLGSQRERSELLAARAHTSGSQTRAEQWRGRSSSCGRSWRCRRARTSPSRTCPSGSSTGGRRTRRRRRAPLWQSGTRRSTSPPSPTPGSSTGPRSPAPRASKPSIRLLQWWIGLISLV